MHHRFHRRKCNGFLKTFKVSKTLKVWGRLNCHNFFSPYFLHFCQLPGFVMIFALLRGKNLAKTSGDTYLYPALTHRAINIALPSKAGQALTECFATPKKNRILYKIPAFSFWLLDTFRYTSLRFVTSRYAVTTRSSAQYKHSTSFHYFSINCRYPSIHFITQDTARSSALALIF